MAHDFIYPVHADTGIYTPYLDCRVLKELLIITHRYRKMHQESSHDIQRKAREKEES